MNLKWPSLLRLLGASAVAIVLVLAPETESDARVPSSDDPSILGPTVDAGGNHTCEQKLQPAGDCEAASSQQP